MRTMETEKKKKKKGSIMSWECKSNKNSINLPEMEFSGGSWYDTFLRKGDRCDIDVVRANGLAALLLFALPFCNCDCSWGCGDVALFPIASGRKSRLLARLRRLNKRKQNREKMD